MFKDYLSSVLSLAATGVIVLLTVRCLNWLKHRLENIGPEKADLHKAERQRALLYDILKKFGAIRAYISIFHNGLESSDGIPFKRKSRTIEVARDGVSYESERVRGQLISGLFEEMELVLHEGPGFFVTSELPPSLFKWINERGGVVSGARIALWKHGFSTPIAFIGVDFDTDKPPTNLPELVDYGKWMEAEL